MKIIKIFLVIIVIISLSIPSFCSLSSDGSSFVTKAEFDSVLADFNGRLTVFETSINSKIDSQVTTYLDRNGIWSGKEQTINAANCQGSFGASELGLDAVGGIGTKEWAPKVYVNEINKSGLLVGNWLWRNLGEVSSNTARWGWCGNRKYADDSPSLNGFSLTFKLYEIKNASTVKNLIYSNTFLIATGKQANNSTNGNEFVCFVPLCTSAINNPLQVFVNNGSQVLWSLYCDYHCPGLSTFTTENTDNSKLYIELGKPKIY